MVDQQLLEFIRAELNAGTPPVAIKQKLAGNGWPLPLIEEAFSGISTETKTSVAPQPDSEPIKFAGFWVRFAANAIDALLISAAVFVLTFILSFLILILYPKSEHFLKSFSPYFGAIASYTYFMWMTYSKGATLGKMAVCVEVRAETGGRLTLGRVVIRETLGKLLSILTLYIGFMMAGWTKKKQALHDKVVHSVVVYKGPERRNWLVITMGILFGGLVGLAILGILASVVLASLNTARGLAKQAKVMATLNKMDLSSQLYYESHKSYGTTGSCSGGIFDDVGKDISGLVNDGAKMQCLAADQSFAIEVQIKSATSTGVTFFCLDNWSGVKNDANLSLENGKARCILPGQSTHEQNLQGNYINEKYGYVMEIPVGWRIAYMSAIFDTAQALAKEHNFEDYSFLDKPEYASELQKRVIQWKSSSANYLILTNLSEKDEAAFYDKVSKKQADISQFPHANSISVYTVDSVTDLESFTKPLNKGIRKLLTLNAGRAGYTQQDIVDPGSTIVRIPFPDKISRTLIVGYSQSAISDQDFLTFLNTIHFE